jgi:rubrerythrin
MDVYDFAMQFEKDGENFYREGARLSANKGLRTILIMLADAEVAHYNTFKGMKEHSPFQPAESPILKDVKNVFVRMKEEGDLEGIEVSELSLYKKAQEIEKRTEEFYLEKASSIENSSEQEIFLRVAGEEKKHYFILQQIIDFVSRPTHWLENAEWYHLEEY